MLLGFNIRLLGSYFRVGFILKCAFGIDKVIMTVYNIAYNEVVKICACGVNLWIKLPIKTLRLCWKTQVFVVCLPFRCTYRAVHYLKYCLITLFGGQKQDNPKQLLLDFLQCDIGEKEKLIKTMHEFRTGSLIAVTKMNILNRELGRCRKQLSLWKIQAERQTKQMSDIVKEEKKLLKVVIGALRRLRALKSSREDIDDKLKNTVEGMLNFSKNLSSKEFSESTYHCPAAEINAVLKAGYNRLHKQTEQMRNIIERKRSFVNLSSKEDCSEINSSKDSTNMRHNFVVDDSPNFTNLSVSTLDTIIGLLNGENLQLKKRLKVTNDQLEEVKNTSLCLNEKIIYLEIQLEDVMNLLRNVEADRDDMREKLLTLHGMIEEEEVFLNDDTFTDDSYSELYIATKQLHSNDFESSSSAEPFDIFSNESDDEIREPKSLELSLSR